MVERRTSQFNLEPKIPQGKKAQLSPDHMGFESQAKPSFEEA